MLYAILQEGLSFPFLISFTTFIRVITNHSKKWIVKLIDTGINKPSGEFSFDHSDQYIDIRDTLNIEDREREGEVMSRGISQVRVFRSMQ
jgi:hypothetical protein